MLGATPLIVGGLVLAVLPYVAPGGLMIALGLPYPTIVGIASSELAQQCSEFVMSRRQQGLLRGVKKGRRIFCLCNSTPVEWTPLNS